MTSKVKMKGVRQGSKVGSEKAKINLPKTFAGGGVWNDPPRFGR